MVATIRPKDLPVVTAPTAGDKATLDGTTTRSILLDDLFSTISTQVVVNKNVSNLPAIGTPAGVAGTAQVMMTLGGANATAADLFIQAFGSSAAVRYFSSAGTAAARTATTNGTTLAANFSYGYSGSAYVVTAGFAITSTELFSGSVSGSRLDLYATPAGTTGVAIAASFGAGLMVGDTVDPGAGAISATKSILSKGATFGIGYATGAGGAVTQITSRTTGVTLNKACGAITLFTAAGSATAASFTVTNSAVAATDCVVVSVKSSTTNKYNAFVTAVGAGSFEITFNTTGGTTSDAPVFNFAVIKGVAA